MMSFDEVLEPLEGRCRLAGVNKKRPSVKRINSSGDRESVKLTTNLDLRLLIQLLHGTL